MTDKQSELIERLRRECEEAIDGEVDETELDDVVLALLSSVTSDFEIDNDDVKGAIDFLTQSSEHVSVDDRRRLTNAAKHGTRYNQRGRQPLQLVLERARAEGKLDAAAVADRLGITVENLVAFEAGNQPLVEIGSTTLARWVDQMNISAQVAGPAIRQSFSMAGSGPRFGGRNRRMIDAEAQAFIDRFLGELNDLSALKEM